ncbi:par-3 family cell polarity regulator beta a [Triplophysa rosa]|uniref:Partitioning defective 3-like protein B-like n=1 Tax=Triplophysa rosa TaxID=992332 RepID=A0A9W7WXB3_TRIRA|nr:par-3 family cell polarity regulator beta a [Triplophysa rosa]KAI7810390.1 putative partitioning defective 3-like protein B-like [Triplophysa rosa]
MKVTVKFGTTGVVVPCRDGWIVRDLIDQATQRYKKIVEQDGEFLVQTHHVEYLDGGILDPDDMLTDLVEDKDKLIAVFDVTEFQQRASVSPGGSEASVRSSPDPSEPELYALQPYSGSEIEVTSSTLKSTTPLLVRSSSDPALAPPLEVFSFNPEEIIKPQSTETGHATTLKGGAMDKPKVDVPNTTAGKIEMSKLTRTVEISGDMGPLGIKVIPYSSSLSGRTLGLHIRSVEENSRSEREGIFKDDECIVQINDVELIDKSFAQSQEVFRQAMSSFKVRLQVLPVYNKLRYEKSLIGQLFNDTDPNLAVPKPKSPFLVRKLGPGTATTPSPEPPFSQTPPLKEEELPLARNTPVEMRKDTPSPPVSVSPMLRDRSESPAPKKTPALATLVNTINKKSGKKMRIDLKKGTEGLGFTVVTRDSSLHGPGPILVKSILPRGAAIKDGRLKSGDRILEVNGVDITGRTQEELVAMLRSTKLEHTVSLIVGRQEDFMPRELQGEASGPLLSEDGREQLMFEVPLSDSGSAGLGVSLKGNKSRETGEDLGIFIKSIIHGGAAHKDGRLRINDQLIAVNSESLLSRSNHDAMETLRHSMSTEGNVRGTIQLVVLRSLERYPAQENHEVSQSPTWNDSPVHQPNGNHANSFTPPAMLNNRIYDSSPAPYRSKRQELLEADYSEDDFPPPPSEMDLLEASSTRKYPQERVEREPVAFMGHPNNQQYPQRQKLLEHPAAKTSKSMDLVADESNMTSIQGRRPEPLSSNGTALGPRLGLQKSSSLESLQTAMEEVSKDEVPFHRPRPHMVRGRGCNLSFRHAIDKSYDRPSEAEDDGSEDDSGRDTPASNSSRQELDDDKKKKKKTKKKKEKKGKKKDEAEDPEKKSKKKGFGLLRFGRKNKEEKNKSKAKNLGALSEEEVDKSEPEIFTSKSERNSPALGRMNFPDVEDDDLDPNYARIDNFRQPPHGTPSHNYSQPSVPAPYREPPNEDALEGLYAKVNKQRTAPPKTDSNEDRLQQIRNQLQQVRPAPSYDDLTTRRRQEYDPSRIRGPDPRLAPRYNDVDRMYASVPRRMPVDDLPNQNWAGQRDPGHYPISSYEYPNQDGYPSRSAHLPVPRADGPGGYYPSSSALQKGPVRQDLPPSPNPGARAPPRYETLSQGNYRTASPDRYGPYGDEQYPDPRQKNPMIGAV